MQGVREAAMTERPSSIIYFRSRAIERGEHEALEEAAREVDALRDEIGMRFTDNVSAGVSLSIALLLGLLIGLAVGAWAFGAWRF